MIKQIVSALFIAGMILSGTNLTGQEDNFSIGPRAGINISDVSNVDGSKSRIGLVAGVSSTYSISETSGITLDILYSQEGYDLDGSPEVDISYLQIPLYFNVFFGELGGAFRPKVYVGIAPGFLLNAESGGTDISDSMAGVVFSLTGGLGFNYRVADRVWLNADVRSFLGLSDIREEEFQTDDKAASRNVQISLGVAFGLSEIE